MNVEILPGVYLINNALKLSVLQKLSSEKLSCHHQDEEGHDLPESYDETEEKKQEKKEPKPKKFRALKPHAFPCVAADIIRKIPKIGAVQKVDAQMQLYRLTTGRGAVTRHIDEDYYGPDGFIAKYSILLYLNDEYSGGETIFDGIYAPHVGKGSGFLFSHNIPHEGLPVILGEKYVLKTDLLLKAP